MATAATLPGRMRGPGGGPSATLHLAARRIAPDHVLPNAVLGLLLALGWGARTDRWLPVLAALALGGTLELLQAAVPGRAPSARDLLSNALGLAAGLALGRALGAALTAGGSLRTRIAARGGVTSARASGRVAGGSGWGGA